MHRNRGTQSNTMLVVVGGSSGSFGGAGENSDQSSTEKFSPSQTSLQTSLHLPRRRTATPRKSKAMSLKAQSCHAIVGDGATDGSTAASPTTVVNTPDQYVVPKTVEKPQSPGLLTVDRHESSIIGACTTSTESTTFTSADEMLGEYNDFVLRVLLHNLEWPDEEIIFKYPDGDDDDDDDDVHDDDVDGEGTATTATATTITVSKKKKKAKSASKSRKGSSSSKCKTTKKSASFKDSKPRKKRSKRMQPKQEGDNKRSRKPKQLKVASFSSTALSSLSDSVHSSATEVSFFDDVNDEVNDHVNVDEDVENVNDPSGCAGSPPTKNLTPPRRHNSAPPRRNDSSSLYIEPIPEVAVEEDQSPVRTSQKPTVVLKPTAKRPTMDELRVSLHMAAREAADVGHHTKLVEKVCEAVADGNGYEDKEDEGENDDWDDYKSDDNYDDAGSSDAAVEKKDTFNANILGTSTHHHRRKSPDEWKLKHGLAVENDLSRSNHFRVINEAAAVGSMRRRIGDVVEVSQARNGHETVEAKEDEGDVQGNNKVPVFLKRRRKLLRTASERMDQYVEDSKIEKKKTMFDPEHVLERQQEYNRIGERISQGDYKWLPTFDPPVFQRPRVWTSRNRIRASVAEEAAKKAEARNHRLNCILRLMVRKSCSCVYCKNPNPFQTVAYQELRQERRHRQPKKAVSCVTPSTDRSALGLAATSSKTSPGNEGKNGGGELYSSTMLRRTVSLSSPITRSNSFKAVTEKQAPAWASPTYEKAPIKIQKRDPSVDKDVPGWDLATSDFKAVNEKQAPFWTVPTLKKTTVKVIQEDTLIDHDRYEGPGWALATGKRNDDLPDWASPALMNLIQGNHGKSSSKAQLQQ